MIGDILILIIKMMRLLMNNKQYKVVRRVQGITYHKKQFDCSQIVSILWQMLNIIVQNKGNTRKKRFAQL